MMKGLKLSKCSKIIQWFICWKILAGNLSLKDYEYELHNFVNPDVHLVEKVLRRKGNEIYVSIGIWIRTIHGYNVL